MAPPRAVSKPFVARRWDLLHGSPLLSLRIAPHPTTVVEQWMRTLLARHRMAAAAPARSANRLLFLTVTSLSMDVVETLVAKAAISAWISKE